MDRDVTTGAVATHPLVIESSGARAAAPSPLILSSPTMVPSWVTPSRELAVLRAWLWLAICVDVVSSCLYLFLPAGTVLYFRGTASPTATFWCTTAATGDSVSALWCFSALRGNTTRELRDAARGLLLFAVVHLGAFVHGHYFIEPIADSGVPYVFALLVGVALGTWFGFYGPVQVPLEGVPGSEGRERGKFSDNQIDD